MKSVIQFVVSLIVFFIVVALVIFVIRVKNDGNITQKDTTNEYIGELVDNIEDAKEDIHNNIDNLGSVYFEVHESNLATPSRYYYNKEDEVLIQSYDGEMTSLIVNGNYITYNNSVQEINFDKRIDFLNICKNALLNIENCNEIYRVKKNEVTEYKLVIKGKDNINKLTDTGINLYKQLKERVSYWEDDIEIGFIINESLGISFYFNLITDEKLCYWKTSYGVNTDDWKLSNKWYKTKFVKDNAQKIYNLMCEDVNNINKIMERTVDDE